MNKIMNLTIMGVFLALAGLVMLFSEKVGIANAKIIIPLFFAISGIFSLRFATANKHVRVASQFQMLQGIGLLIFSVVIAFLPDSLESFLMYVTYFMLVFGLFEIMVSFFVLNSKTPIIKNIITFRLIGGFLISIGAVILLLTTIADKYEGLIAAGVLTILIGISNIIFASKVKKVNIQE